MNGLADGKIVIETGLDTSGIEAGLGKMKGALGAGAKAAAVGIAAVSTGLIATGAAAVSAGKDYKQAFNTIQASTGATKQEMEGLGESIKNVYADNFGDDMMDVAESMSAVKKNIGGAAEEIENTTKLAIGFRDTFGYEVPESTRAAKALIDNFGVSAEEAYNLMAQGAQNGLDYSGELIDNINEYSVQFGKAGLSAEDMFNIMQAGADTGAWNLDKIGDAVKELNIRLVDGSDTTKEGLETIGLNADEVAQKMSQGGETAKQTYQEVIQRLAAMDDKQAQNIAGVNLFGTMWEDLGPEVVTQLANIEGSYDQTKSTMEEINGVKYDDIGSAIETLGRHVQTGLLLPLGEELTPAFGEAADAGIEFVDRLSSALEGGGIEGLIQEAGNVFSDIAANAADAAPEMIEAATSMVESFAKGIARNKTKIANAAIDIAKTLASGLIKFLPKEMQKPAQDAIDALCKSLESGGLRDAVQTAVTTISNLADAVESIASVALPMFTSAVDFAGRHMEDAIAVVTALATAYGALKIVTFLSGGIQALSTALMANTAVTKLTTAAHSALNLVLAASPVGLAVAGFAAIAGVMTAYAITTDEVTEGQKRLEESQEALADKFSEVGSAASDFVSGIATAESYLSSFDSTLFASSEEQQNLTANMQEVQSGITSICRTASEERREYTAEEIEQLDQYFQRLNELNEQQLAVEQARAEAIKQQAITFSETYNGSLEDYTTTSQSWIATAQEQADAQTKIVEEQTTREIALLNERYGDQAGMQNEAYAEEYNRIYERGEQEKELIQSNVADITASLAEGYSERITADEEFQALVQEANTQKEEEQARYQEQLEALEAEHNARMSDYQYDRYSEENRYTSELKELENEHQANLAQVWDRVAEDMDSAQAEQLGIWLGMLATTTSSGGQLTDETKSVVKSLLESWDELPDGAKDTMMNTVKPMLEELSAAEPQLKGIAEKDGQAVIDALRNVLQVHSPSQVTMDIAQNTVTGLKNPLVSGVAVVQAAGRNLGNGLISALRALNLPGQAQSLGIDFANGYINGMSSRSSAVSQAAASLANSALAAVRSAQASASPSKKAAKLGRDFTDGYCTGMEKRLKNVQKTAIQLANAALNTLLAANGNYEEAGAAAIESFESGMDAAVEKSEKKIEKLIDKQVAAATKAYKKSIKKENAKLKAEYKKRNAELEAAVNAESDSKKKRELEQKIKENERALDKQIDANEKKLKTFEDNYEKLGSATLKAYTSALETEAKAVKERLSDAIDEITKDYQAKYDKIVSMRESMQSKLSGSSLFDREDDEMILTDWNAELANITKYEANLTKLKGKISADLLTEITDLGVEDAIEYSDKLLSMSEAELSEYSRLYDKKNKAAKEAASRFYQAELDAIQTEFTGKVNAAFATAKTEMKDIGKNVVEGFIEGMNSQTKKLANAVKKLSKSIIKQVKKDFGINSPSKVFRGIAANCTDGYEMEYEKGMKAVQKTVSKSNEGIIKAAKKNWDYGQLAAQMRAGIAAEQNAMAQRIAAYTEAKYRPEKAEPAPQSSWPDTFADDVVNAFVQAGIGIKVGQREFGRLVREANR